MAIARETVRLGLAARGAAKIKVRQPLHEAVVVAAGREREAIERLGDVVREELNVKVLRFVDEADELGSYTLKPNYRTLGPRFGKAMPQVAEAVAALDADHVADVAARGPAGRRLHRRPRPHARARTTCCVALAPLQGYQLEREGSHAVALELTLDDDLRREGLAREIVHAVQIARREAGPGHLRPHRPRRSTATRRCSRRRARTRRTSPARCSPSSVAYAANGSGETASIEGRELRISVARAADAPRHRARAAR